MWITVFLGCLTVIFHCNCQEVTNFDVPAVTETTGSNQGVEWDSTGPSVSLSINDGRSDNANRPRNELSNHPLFYSNQWQPLLRPIDFNYGIQNGHRAEGEDNINYQFMPTFLRRPDSDLNLTSPILRAQPTSDFRNPLVPVPIPMTPFNPLLFYRHIPHLPFDVNSLTTRSSSILQNSSAPTPAVSNAGTLRDEQHGEITPSPHFEAIPDDLERVSPINFFRSTEAFLPPIAPAFVPPFPIVPNTNDNSFHPVVYPYANGHIFDREAGSEIIENKPGGQGIPEIEAPLHSEVIPKFDATVPKAISSDSAPAFVPPEPLPLPVGAFPFGVLPPPILSPILPNPGVPRGLQLSPLAEPINLPKGSIETDATAPQSPISLDLPLEATAGVLPPVNTLQPETEISATIESNAERILRGEKPNEFKIPYEFGFDMNDGKGTDQHRKEVSDVSGTVRGSYGYRDMFGVYRFVNYIADKNGFRAFIKSNEPGVASSGSADVVVMAERPPPQAIAEGEKVIEPEALIVPDAVTDLVAEGSETQSK